MILIYTELKSIPFDCEQLTCAEMLLCVGKMSSFKLISANSSIIRRLRWSRYFVLGYTWMFVCSHSKIPVWSLNRQNSQLFGLVFERYMEFSFTNRTIYVCQCLICICPISHNVIRLSLPWFSRANDMVLGRLYRCHCEMSLNTTTIVQCTCVNCSSNKINKQIIHKSQKKG